MRKENGPTMNSLLDVVRSVPVVACVCDGIPELDGLKSRIRAIERNANRKADAAHSQAYRKAVGPAAQLRKKLNIAKQKNDAKNKKLNKDRTALILRIKSEGATERNIIAAKKFAGID